LKIAKCHVGDVCLKDLFGTVEIGNLLRFLIFATQFTVFCDAVAGKKKALNVGRSGGSAGLEDYSFDDPLDDDYDFM
jgi:hypothetical protein